MSTILTRIKQEDCKRMSYSIKENGLVEIIAPKTWDDKKIAKRFFNMEFKEFDSIRIQQDREVNSFRKKIMPMVHEYMEKYKIPGYCGLRIAYKTEELFKGDVKIYRRRGTIRGMITLNRRLVFDNADWEDIIPWCVYEIGSEYEYYSEM